MRYKFRTRFDTLYIVESNDDPEHRLTDDGRDAGPSTQAGLRLLARLLALYHRSLDVAGKEDQNQDGETIEDRGGDEFKEENQ